MKKMNLMAIVACIGLAFGLTSCKDEKKLVGSWEVVKTQQILTYTGETLATWMENIDTTYFPQAGESTVLTFSKKGVVLEQTTDAKGNVRSSTDAYTIIDDKLYFNGGEFTMSFSGKDLTLTHEKTLKSEWTKYDYNTGETTEYPYTIFEKRVMYLKEH